MRASFLGVALSLTTLLVPAPASGANFVIADGDVAALVAAVTTANGNGEPDTITLAAGGFYALSTAAEGSVGLPPITAGPLTIEGSGATIFRTLQAPPFRVMEIRPPATVTLNDLTLSNGDSGGRNSFVSRGANLAILPPPLEMGVARSLLPTVLVTLNRCIVSGGIAGRGAGIFVEADGAVLTLSASFVTGNGASQGAGLAVLGAATVTIDHTSIGSNTAFGLQSGGSGGALGGGILTLGASSITIVDSAISGNETSPSVQSDESRGAGIADTGGATFDIRRSELVGNVARFGGVNQGGGIWAGSANGTFRVANTTFSNNLAGGVSAGLVLPRGSVALSDSHGGAIADEGGSDFALRNVTIARNFAFRGAGVAVADGGGGSFTIANSIVAENTADDRPDCSGTIASLGHNLIGDTSGCVVPLGTGDQIAVDPMLGPAQDNGGGTTTHALLAGSPAIDGGDPAGCTDAASVLLAVDQRGFPRPSGARCDAGAFELATTSEVCDNCLDDDGDQANDREDADCTSTLDAGGVGLGDAARGKALGKCAQAIAKAGGKFVATESKRLQKCLQTTSQCVQQKPGDAKCLAKAEQACARATFDRPADVARFGATVRAKCAPPALAADDLLADAGLGFAHESPLCQRFGISTIASVDDVVACMVSLHACRAQEMIGLQYPRAVELFGVSGGSAAAFSCLAAGADGGGTGTGDPKVEGKQAVGCAKGLAKAGRKFASAKLAVAQKCALAVSKCLQEKPADMACLPKARKTCAQQVGKITAPQGLRAKLVATVVRACDAPGLGIDATLASTGIGFGARAQLCAGLAVVNLATIADVAACLERQHECRVEQALEAELPRLRELLAIGGVALP